MKKNSALQPVSTVQGVICALAKYLSTWQAEDFTRRHIFLYKIFETPLQTTVKLL
jgi:hypothetical protein